MRIKFCKSPSLSVSDSEEGQGKCMGIYGSQCQRENMESEKNIDDDTPYHERQHKELCALHVLNNLFQDKNPSDRFTKKDLDDICVK